VQERAWTGLTILVCHWHAHDVVHCSLHVSFHLRQTRRCRSRFRDAFRWGVYQDQFPNANFLNLQQCAWFAHVLENRKAYILHLRNLGSQPEEFAQHGAIGVKFELARRNIDFNASLCAESTLHENPQTGPSSPTTRKIVSAVDFFAITELGNESDKTPGAERHVHQFLEQTPGSRLQLRKHVRIPGSTNSWMGQVARSTRFEFTSWWYLPLISDENALRRNPTEDHEWVQ
jgi:hypothetical protein